MRLIIFVAVIVGIAVIFGAVYGISALLEKKKRGPVMKTMAPDDDPEFLRNLARKLDEQEAAAEAEDAEDEQGNEDQAGNDK
jgi:hypothetical protein